MATPPRKSSSTNQRLTPRKINACLFGTDDSEIEDFNDEENEDNVLSASTREQSLFQANWSDNTDSDPDYHPSTSDSDNEPTTSTAVKKNQLAKRKKNTKLQPPIKRTKNIPTAEPWRKGIFSPDPVTLHEPSYIPLDCTNWSNEESIHSTIRTLKQSGESDGDLEDANVSFTNLDAPSTSAMDIAVHEPVAQPRPPLPRRDLDSPRHPAHERGGAAAYYMPHDLEMRSSYGTVQPDLIQESFPKLYSLLGQNITKHENLIQDPEDVVDPSVNGYEPETGHHLPAEIVQEDCSSNSSLFSDNDLDDPTYVPQESSESEISFSDVIEISQPTTVDTNTVPTAVSNQYKLVPYSDSDSNDDMINIPEKGKKRVRNPVNWKKKH
ncbi:uncharacterized protein LOC124370336 [Homalodisca vitripennis]|uniref:uncharacterized protein LOC124370336 n=1 Tax=Homalodisca vitripennis TaxID=197043 RepID=UPI001EEC4523|nr:uncharacterized protein LOC124370336 [Homalodisca vitripennis]